MMMLKICIFHNLQLKTNKKQNHSNKVLKNIIIKTINLLKPWGCYFKKIYALVKKHTHTHIGQ